MLSDVSVRETRDGRSRVLPSGDSDEVGRKGAWDSLLKSNVPGDSDADGQVALHMSGLLLELRWGHGEFHGPKSILIPTASFTNYYKFSSLKEHKIILF